MQRITVPSSFPSCGLGQSNRVFAVKDGSFFVPMRAILAMAVANTIAFAIRIRVRGAVTFFRLTYKDQGRVGTTPQHVDARICTVLISDLFRNLGVTARVVGTM